MEVFNDLINKIIQFCNAAYVYAHQCKQIMKVIREISIIPRNQINDDIFNELINQLNLLSEVIDGFKYEKWSENCLSIKVMEPIEKICSIMNSINELLKKSNIILETKYKKDRKLISFDLNFLHEIFADPSKLHDVKPDDPMLHERIAETEDRLRHYAKGKPTGSQSEIDHDLTITAIIDASISIDDDLDKSTTQGTNDPKISDFSDVQKFIIKKSYFESLIEDKVTIRDCEWYTIDKCNILLEGQIVPVNVTEFKENSETIENSEIIEKFRRTVNVLIQAKHPNIESFIGAINEPPYYAIVTRRIGEKLSEILKEKKMKKRSSKSIEKPIETDVKNHVVLKEGDRTIIAFNIAKAMAYLHSLNIIHRDLCSSNITVDNELNARITNFTRSRFIPEESLLMSLNTSGSSSFRAPEFMDDYNQSVDVFAFGGLLYELTTNSPPFDEISDPYDVEMKISRGDRPEIPEKASDDLKKLIQSCWAQNPNERPTFAEIIDEMLTKKIVIDNGRHFEEESKAVNEFYSKKSSKNCDLDACLELFKSIADHVRESGVFVKEAVRAQSFLYGYQSLLQTSDLLLSNEYNDPNIETQLSNLRESLEELDINFRQIQNDVWETLCIITPVNEFSEYIHSLMEEIYVSMKGLNFHNLVKYDYVNSDLLYDFRIVYKRIKYKNIDHSNEKDRQDRLKEIDEFLSERGMKIEPTKEEIGERISQVFSLFKNRRIERKDYTIFRDEKIGGGMSSIVYKGIQNQTNMDVAIKEFKHSYSQDLNNITLFRREISFLVYLQNEYLVKFIGFNTDPKEKIWVICDLYSGDLSKAIKKDQLNPFQKTKIAFEIAEGMEYLHSKRVLHRDLKPLNILLDNDTPKITDFGYSKTNNSLMMTRNVGTDKYMAPEVKIGNYYGYKADVYSYALILYDMCKSPRKLDKNDPLLKLINDGKKENPSERPSFSQIIQRMINEKIAYNGADADKIDAFYKMKAEKRSEKK